MEIDKLIWQIIMGFTREVEREKQKRLFREGEYTSNKSLLNCYLWGSAIPTKNVLAHGAYGCSLADANTGKL